MDSEELEREARQGEQALLDALLASADDIERSVVRFEVPRIQVPLEREDGSPVLDADGEPRTGPLAFHLHILTDDLRQDCKRRATDLVTGRLDEARMNRLLVLAATDPSDMERVWRNKRLWKALGVGKPEDLIRKVLLPGEISIALLEVWKLSGFASDAAGAAEIAKSGTGD